MAVSASFDHYAFGDSLVVVGRDRLHLLNATGRFIWELHTEGLASGHIAARLAASYDIPRDLADRDVAALLSAWQAAGLIAAEPAADAADQAAREQQRGNRVPPPAAAAAAAAAERVYWMFDQPVRLRFGSRELERAVHPLVQHLHKSVPTGEADIPTLEVIRKGAEFSIWSEGEQVFCRSTLDDLVTAVISEMIEQGYRHRDWLVALHAGAVSDGTGCIALPARSGGGKSTLTAALTAEGFIYLSDEVVPLLRPDALAVPLPLSLCLKPGSLPMLASRYPGIDALPEFSRSGQSVHFLAPPGFELHPPQQAYPVKALVFLDYRPAATTTLATIDATEALQRLLESNLMFPLPLQGAAVAEFLGWLEGMPAYRLTYSDLGEAVERIRALFAR